MPYIKSNDTNLYYETFGQGEPLVFISGFAVDHMLWQNIVPLFAKHYQVITFDNRGLGKSDCPDYPYTIEMMADDVAGLCQALNLQQVRFVGSSMGGAITQVLAYKYPELTKSAVIANSMSELCTRIKLFITTDLELMHLGVPPKITIKPWISWCYSKKFLDRDHMIESLFAVMLNKPNPITLKGYEHQTEALLAFDSTPWLSQIKCPCLVISSDEDYITNAKSVEHLASMIPNAQYFNFVGGVGHIPHIEQPETFCKIVLEFLR